MTGVPRVFVHTCLGVIWVAVGVGIFCVLRQEEQPKIVTKDEFTAKPAEKFYRRKFNGHTYVVYMSGGVYTGPSIVHDPDCTHKD